MGGKAFAEAQGSNRGLKNFPRMPPPLYKRLVQRVLKLLRQSYDTTRLPAEAPEKQDHGDIDVLVHSSQWPDAGGKEDLATLAKAFDATQTRFFGSGRWSLAVPFSSPCFEDVDLDPLSGNWDDDLTKAFVQIDIHVCKTVERLTWLLFKNAYGDLWQILGVIIRPYGMTADERYLNVRIQEVEENGGSKDEQRVKLTRDPVETMEFLGLDADVYAAGFSTEVAIFEWATKCRFFHTASLFRHLDEDDEMAESTNLNHNDRARFKKRLMYTRFRDWVRDHIDTLSQDNTLLTRSTVFAEAIARFDAQAQADKVLPRFRLKIREQLLKCCVAAALEQILAGDNDIATRVMRGLKTFVHLDASGMPFVSEQRQSESKEAPGLSGSKAWAECALSDDQFVDWVLEHWQEVDGLEVARRAEGGRKAYEERQRKRTKARSGKRKCCRQDNQS